MPARDDERWIKVHDKMPEHPKVGGLSDKAFRLLIETWCWCKRQRNDGRFPLAAWHRMGTAKTRAELESAALVEIIVEFVDPSSDLANLASLAEIANHSNPRSPERRDLAVIHDWLTWQTGNGEVTEKRRRAGALGNHKRWHQAKGIVDPTCEHCSQDRKPVASAIAKGSQTRSQNRRKRVAEKEISTSIQDFSSDALEDQRAREDREEEHDHPRNGRPVRDEPVGRGCSPKAHKIIREHAASRSRRPPAARLASLGVEVDRLLAEDWTEIDISRGLEVLDEKRLGPSKLGEIVYELAELPRNVYEIPDAELTEADIEEILGPVAMDPDLPRSAPEDVVTRAALEAWRKREFPRFLAKRRERAIRIRRERLDRAATRQP